MFIISKQFDREIIQRRIWLQNPCLVEEDLLKIKEAFVSSNNFWIADIYENLSSRYILKYTYNVSKLVWIFL